MRFTGHYPLCRGNLPRSSGLLQHEVLYVVVSGAGTAYLHRTPPNPKRVPHAGAVAYVPALRNFPAGQKWAQYDKVKDTVYIPSDQRIQRFLILHGKVNVQGEPIKSWRPPATGGLAADDEDLVNDLMPEPKAPLSVLRDLERYTPLTDTTLNTVKATMKPIEITTKTLVNGQDFGSMTDDALYNLIRKAEDRIKELSDIENKPAKLTAEIEAHKAGIKALVELMDGRVAKP